MGIYAGKHYNTRVAQMHLYRYRLSFPILADVMLLLIVLLYLVSLPYDIISAPCCFPGDADQPAGRTALCTVPRHLHPPPPLPSPPPPQHSCSAASQPVVVRSSQDVLGPCAGRVSSTEGVRERLGCPQRRPE